MNCSVAGCDLNADSFWLVGDANGFAIVASCTGKEHKDLVVGLFEGKIVSRAFDSKLRAEDEAAQRSNSDADLPPKPVPDDPEARCKCPHPGCRSWRIKEAVGAQREDFEIAKPGSGYVIKRPGEKKWRPLWFTWAVCAQCDRPVDIRERAD